MAKSSFTRREFLKVSALNTSVLALGACSSLDRFFTGDKRDLTNEVVILGAGAAGLAAAAELKKRKIPFRLFESSSRVGGRVQSVKVFPELDSVAELGAEFIEGNHSHVMGLAKELNLSLNEIKTVPGLEAHLFSFNKKIYQIKDIAPRLKSLREPFQNIRVDLFDDDEDAVLNFKNAGQYAQSKYYDSLSLKALLDSWAGEVDPVILKLIEIQSVQRFGVEAKDQSCLHFISTLDETGSSLLTGRPLYAMTGGLSRLTQTLAERVAGVIPDRIVKLNSPLVKISEEQNVFTLTFESERRKEIYHAQHVICTLPFSKLREVSGIESLKFSALKKDNIFGQSYGTHSKGVLGFSSPFWRSRHGNVPGRLGNYTGDFLTQKMWDASREQEGKKGLLAYQRGGISGINAGGGAEGEALKDLSLFQSDVPGHSISSQFVNWSQRKWSRGSMAVFKPGDYTKFKGVAALSEYDGRFQFAGEHTSLQHAGTLEGALESGLRAAIEISDKLFKAQG